MWNWFKLFNFDEFIAADIPCRDFVAVLQGIGTETILISRGNILSITFRGVYLPVNLLDINPKISEGYGSFIDEAGDVWLGIEV